LHIPTQNIVDDRCVPVSPGAHDRGQAKLFAHLQSNVLDGAYST
jgi:hypothetical protein